MVGAQRARKPLFHGYARLFIGHVVIGIQAVEFHHAHPDAPALQGCDGFQNDRGFARRGRAGKNREIHI
ncbi:hypothetical protein SDC9_95317 [bioreactor metagenome]|uniref:Uncharacterized protein n=1 Tax=bioreactor metagenome TaxID=1076179 RepID=A0A645A674_9ZZZZ